MRQIVLTVGLTAVLAGFSATACAQFGNNLSNSGSSGRGGFGSTGGFGGSSSFGNSGLSSGGFGNTGGFGTGSGGFGGGGFGTGGFGGGMSSMGGQSGFGLGQNQQGGNFIGANNNPNQFLGRGNQNQAGAMGVNGTMMNQFGNTGGRGNRGNRGGLNAIGNLFNTGNSGGNNNAMPVIRPRQRVAFEYPVPKGEVLHSTLQSQLGRVTARHPGLSNVQLTMNPGGEVVLRGAVSSEAEAKLAVNLMRLEPGVRTVLSELTFPEPESRPDAE